MLTHSRAGALPLHVHGVSLWHCCRLELPLSIKGCADYQFFSCSRSNGEFDHAAHRLERCATILQLQQHTGQRGYGIADC